MSARMYARAKERENWAKRDRATIADSARQLLTSMNPGRSTTFVGVYVTRWTTLVNGVHLTEYEIGGKGGPRRLSLEAAVLELARMAETLPRGIRSGVR